MARSDGLAHAFERDAAPLARLSQPNPLHVGQPEPALGVRDQDPDVGQAPNLFLGGPRPFGQLRFR